MSKTLRESKDYFGKNSFNLEELLDEGILSEEEVSQLKDKIDSVDFFQSLNNNNLLKFSISNLDKLRDYGNTLKSSSKKYKEIQAITKDDKSLYELLDNNIDVLKSHYDDLNSSAKQQLETQFRLLINSQEEMADGKLDSSFEGIVINAYPNVDLEGQIVDFYRYDSQQIDLCATNIAGLRDREDSNWSMSMLAHESAHAIDDIYCKLSSLEQFLAKTIDSDSTTINGIIKKLPEILGTKNNKKTIKLYFDSLENELKIKFEGGDLQKSIINWSKDINDNRQRQIDKHVSEGFIRPYQDRISKNTSSVKETAGGAAATGSSPKSDSSISGKGAIIGSSVPTEILSFHVEEFFNILNSLSNISDEIKQNRFKEIIERKEASETPDRAELIAREIVHEATADFYELLSKGSPELKPFIDIMRNHEKSQNRFSERKSYRHRRDFCNYSYRY